LTLSASWRDLRQEFWGPEDRSAVRVVDELHRHSTVSDEVWSEMNAARPREQAIELIFASSVYHMAAFFLNSAAVPLEEGQARFPPEIKQAEVEAG
jgi:alkylhydroperoxidase family enzyme